DRVFDGDGLGLVGDGGERRQTERARVGFDRDQLFEVVALGDVSGEVAQTRRSTGTKFGDNRTFTKRVVPLRRHRERTQRWIAPFQVSLDRRRKCLERLAVTELGERLVT